MLFRKALRRDLLNLAGIVFATLFVIMITTSMVRLLGRAAGGRVDSASVLPLIAFNAIHLLPVLLVLTLYVSVLTALTRAYRDSEMVVWFASGQSLLAWVRPVLGFATPFALIIAIVAFVGAPWANREAAEYQQRFAQREDVSQVAAGQFRESVAANRVFFVESLDSAQTAVRNVFVTQQQGERESIVVSSGGHIEVHENGDRFLVLVNGRRYDGEQGRADFRLMEFDRYGIRLDPRPTGAADTASRQQTTAQLLADPNDRNLGELLWRIGLPISAFLMALLAIPLSAMNPRGGRSTNLLAALFLYVLYNNLVSIMQAWVAQGRVSFALGVWIIHAALASLIVYLFWRRLQLPRRPLLEAIRLRRSRG